MFGARGDGLYDDMLSIQAAIDSPSTINITFPDGVYLVGSQVIMKSGLHIDGSGTIKSTPNPTFKTGTNPSHYAVVVAHQITGFSIKNITINTEDVLSVPSGRFSLRAFLAYRSADFFIKDCKFFVNGGATAVLGCNTYWIESNLMKINVMTGTTDAVCDNWSQGNPMFDCHITNNIIQGNGAARWGILFNGAEYESSDWSINRITIKGNTVNNCQLDAIWCGGREPAIQNFVISSNVLENARKGVSLSSCISGVVQGNVINNCTSRGIHLWKEGGYTGEVGVEGVLIQSNIIKKVSGTVSGIAVDLETDSLDNSIIDNKLTDDNFEFSFRVHETCRGNRLLRNEMTKGVVNNAARENLLSYFGYTPLITNRANTSGHTLIRAFYTSDGESVTATVRFSCSAVTAGTFSEVDVQLPTEAASVILSGVASNIRNPASVDEGVTSGTFRVTFFAAQTSPTTYSATVTYKASI
jgi:hypothetical protein